MPTTPEDEALLTTELFYFSQSEDYYRRHYAGRYILIHGSTFYGSFTTGEEAYAEGVKEFGNVPMLIKRVVDPSEKYDYGDRQERADHIMKALRSNPDKIYRGGPPGSPYTYAEIADQIEKGTQLGRTVVAVGGLVFQALKATPEFFKR
jgi:hypothetical protein